MTELPRLLTQAERDARRQRLASPIEDVIDRDLVTPFGTYALRVQDGVYMLSPVDTPAARLLNGANDTFGNPVRLEAVDDADALQQSVLLVWGRVNRGASELYAMMRQLGAVHTPPKADDDIGETLSIPF